MKIKRSLKNIKGDVTTDGDFKTTGVGKGFVNNDSESNAKRTRVDKVGGIDTPVIEDE